MKNQKPISQEALQLVASIFHTIATDEANLEGLRV